MLLILSKDWLEKLLESGGLSALIIFIAIAATMLCIFLIAEYLHEINKKVKKIQQQADKQNEINTQLNQRIIELLYEISIKTK